MPYNAAGIAEIRETFSDIWAPVRVESVCDWIESNVELPTGAMTGKVSMKMIPYGREILERFGDKTTRHLVLCCPTQIGKTTLLTCGLLYRIARDPEDAMMVFGNADQARDFSKERLMPFVRLCKPVMAQVPRTSRGIVDKHLWGFTSQHYRSMVLNLVGAGSSTNLSSRPRGLIVMDEVDKMYSEIGFDAGTIQLAEERQKSFNFPLAVKASSPTTSERMCWQEFLKTDQRHYWVKCPRCEQEILLRFKITSEKHGDCGLRWWHDRPDEAKTDGVWDMKKVRANAFYKCQQCAGMIHDFEREGMIQDGVWKPDNTRAETGRHGYHLNSLYSILSQQTCLGQIAIQFLTARGLRSELQSFMNGWLAQPWDEAEMYEHKALKLEIFTPQDIPQDDSTPLMAIDCQHGHFYCLVRRFQRPSEQYPNGQSWLTCADRVDTEDELKEIQLEYGVDGANVTADMAFRPNQVGRMIIERDWRGIWGSSTKKFRWVIDGRPTDRPFSVPQFRDPMLGTSWESRTFQRARYTLFWKDGFMDNVSSLRHAEPTIWHISANVSPRYARQLNSRVKELRKSPRTGRPEWIWRDLHSETHFLDCEAHVAVRAMQLGLLKMPDETANPRSR